MNDQLIQLIKDITVPCTDDGKTFVDCTRINVIKNVLSNTNYEVMQESPLALIYKHKSFNMNRPACVVSSHIDSVYTKFYTETTKRLVKGTFDNSVCTAVLVHTMINASLHPQTIVAFTGNEEQGGIGASQVSEFIKTNLWSNPDWMSVISLDLTNECYRNKSYTFENVFPEEMTDVLKILFPDGEIIEKAAPDDSWTYKKHAITCYSLCLPCRNIGSDMHNDKGVSIKNKALKGYTEALVKLCS